MIAHAVMRRGGVGPHLVSRSWAAPRRRLSRGRPRPRSLRGDARGSRLWDDREAVKLLLVLTSLAAAIGMAASARADGNDDAFLASLQAAGLTYPDPGRAIAAGKWVCKMADQGTQMVDVVKTVQKLNPRLQEDSAAKFTAIAANVYCPQALGLTGH